jgi:hypothetical protein
VEEGDEVCDGWRRGEERGESVITHYMGPRTVALARGGNCAS